MGIEGSCADLHESQHLTLGIDKRTCYGIVGSVHTYYIIGVLIHETLHAFYGGFCNLWFLEGITYKRDLFSDSCTGSGHGCWCRLAVNHKMGSIIDVIDT